MGGIIAWLAGPFGTFAVIAAGALVIWGAFAANNFAQRQRGAELAVAKIEKSNNDAVRKADAVGSRSLDRNVRGRRDPHSID